MNKKVLTFSILGLIFVALAILVDWLFLIGAIVFMLLNQRALFGSKSKSKDI